jgi:saccharopine dehydrogenase-like NADP-dependent oxidoreductase
MVLLHHEIDVFYPECGKRERILSTFTDFGQLGGHTAMSRTVGLPAATGALLILQGTMPASGCRIPTEAAIYEPVLAALRAEGLEFHEEIKTLPTESLATR